MADLVIIVQDSNGIVKQEKTILDHDPKDIIVAKIGDADFPATEEILTAFAEHLQVALRSKGDHKFLLWNHAISFERISLR